MLGTYTYNEIFKKTVVGFGTLFNNIELHKKDANGNVVSIIKVPFSYSGKQKFLARLQQNPELNKKFEIGVPRMAFELTGISYDPSRKASPIQLYKKTTPGSQSIKSQYLPVPYNLNFELYIFGKINDDVLQTIEQILPYFQPSFNITIDLIPEMDEKKDVPIILNNISIEDDYEGSFETRRALIYTLQFTAKTYVYGPVNPDNGAVIKKVEVDTYVGTGASYGKVRTYVVQPNPPTAGPEDNFGFIETITEYGP